MMHNNARSNITSLVNRCGQEHVPDWRYDERQRLQLVLDVPSGPLVAQLGLGWH